jgi:hypothetical protein
MNRLATFTKPNSVLFSALFGLDVLLFLPATNHGPSANVFLLPLRSGISDGNGLAQFDTSPHLRILVMRYSHGIESYGIEK